MKRKPVSRRCAHLLLRPLCLRCCHTYPDTACDATAATATAQRCSSAGSPLSSSASPGRCGEIVGRSWGDGGEVAGRLGLVAGGVRAEGEQGEVKECKEGEEGKGRIRVG